MNDTLNWVSANPGETFLIGLGVLVALGMLLSFVLRLVRGYPPPSPGCTREHCGPDGCLCCRESGCQDGCRCEEFVDGRD